MTNDTPRSEKARMEKLIEETEQFWKNVTELDVPEYRENAPRYIRIFSHLRSLSSELERLKKPTRPELVSSITGLSEPCCGSTWCGYECPKRELARQNTENLASELVAILMKYAGETLANEGAVGTLNRKLAELERVKEERNGLYRFIQLCRDKAKSEIFKKRCDAILSSPNL